jgi:hypothetical protein
VTVKRPPIFAPYFILCHTKSLLSVMLVADPLQTVAASIDSDNVHGLLLSFVRGTPSYTPDTYHTTPTSCSGHFLDSTPPNSTLATRCYSLHHSHWSRTEYRLPYTMPSRSMLPGQTKIDSYEWHLTAIDQSTQQFLDLYSVQHIYLSSSLWYSSTASAPPRLITPAHQPHAH